MTSTTFTASPSERRASRLIMTDVAFLFILLLSVFFAMDPFLLYIDKRTAFKHTHLMLAIPAFVLAWAGMRIGKKPKVTRTVTSICWPLMVFSAWVIAGAMYARIQLNIVESFLILGLYLTVTFGAARFIADHNDPTKILNSYLAFIILSLVVGSVWQAAGLQVWSKFHEMEAFTVPLAVYFYVKAQTPQARAMAIIFMIALMLLVIKNTSFIAMGMALAYVWWCFIRPAQAKRHTINRIFHYYGIIFTGTLIAGTYIGIKYVFTNALPDGNTKYRFFTYERTWNDFLESPIWGKLFAGAGAEQFGLFQVGASTQILPSHSDLLDILGQGGILGMLLFTIALLKIVIYVRYHFGRRKSDTLNSSLTAHFHWIAVSCICTIPVIAFNPILLQPGKAFVTWMNLGVLIGLAMRCEQAQLLTSQKKMSENG